MADLDTRPKVVNVTHYGGDTLTLKITAPDALVAGMTWAAQVRPSRESTQVDGVFTVIDGGAGQVPGTTVTFLQLDSATTSQLVGASGLKRTMEAGTYALVLIYKGVWDVQVSDNGSDPVRTLAHGDLTIELDVTRA